MWISQYMTTNSFSDRKTSSGEVSFSDGEKNAVVSSNEFFNVRALSPCGIRYVPVVGADSVVIHTDRGDYLLSVMEKPTSLSEGELELRSKGGASIVLKNDGRVLINGREIG